jgi:hypothetical protein
MRRMHRLSDLLFVALLLLSLPVQACGLVMREAVTGGLRVSGVGPDDSRKCSTPPLSLPAFSFNQKVTSSASPDAVDGSDRHWASSSEYRWEPDVDRAMDQMFKPPSGVNLFVTQTREEVRDGIERNYQPNSTLGAIELEIKW